MSTTTTTTQQQYRMEDSGGSRNRFESLNRGEGNDKGVRKTGYRFARCFMLRQLRTLCSLNVISRPDSSWKMSPNKVQCKALLFWRSYTIFRWKFIYCMNKFMIYSNSTKRLAHFRNEFHKKRKKKRKGLFLLFHSRCGVRKICRFYVHRWETWYSVCHIWISKSWDKIQRGKWYANHEKPPKQENQCTHEHINMELMDKYIHMIQGEIINNYRVSVEFQWIELTSHVSTKYYHVQIILLTFLEQTRFLTWDESSLRHLTL